MSKDGTIFVRNIVISSPYYSAHIKNQFKHWRNVKIHGGFPTRENYLTMVTDPENYFSNTQKH